MPIQDSVPVATLERSVSTDFTTFQNLVNRSIAELAASLIRTIEVNIVPTAPTTTVRSHVASGLQIDTNGATIYVRTGFLIQNVSPSPPDVPTPDAFDSDYRFGLHLADEDVTDPWDGTSAFWLLEGRVERETTLQEFRDIYTPASQTFAPSAVPLDKRYESQIEFQWIKGSATDIPTPTAGWAPIGWAYRPIGGGAISENVVGSLSIQLEDLAPKSSAIGRANVQSYRYGSTQGIGRASTGINCDFQAEANGLKLMYQGSGLQIKSAEYVVAADVAALAAAGTIGYIYLAPLPDAMPSKTHNASSITYARGVLILSRTRPNEFGMNNAAITPPAPFTNYTIPAKTAAHVGIIRSNGAGTAIEFVSCSRSGHGRVNAKEFNNGTFQLAQGNGYLGPAGPSYTLVNLGPGGTEDVPWGVQLECYLEHDIIDTAAAATSIEMTFGMGTGGAADDIAQPLLWPQMTLSTKAWTVREFMLYPQPNDLTMTVAFRPLDTAGVNTGGGAADGGTNVFYAGWHGFQF